MYVFNLVLKAGTVSLIRRSVVISSGLMERQNENLEMRLDCLAQVDEEDIDLRISQHELAAEGSKSQYDNEIGQCLTLCT